MVSERTEFKLDSILAELTLDGNTSPPPTKLQPRIVRPFVDGFNWLAFHRLTQMYVKELKSRQYSPTSVKKTQHTLYDYASFLETGTVDLVENTTKDTWHDYALYLFDRKLSRVTIAHYQGVLRAFYKFLKAGRILKVDPFAGLHSPRRDKRLPQFLSEGEARTLIEAPDLSIPEGHRKQAERWRTGWPFPGGMGLNFPKRTKRKWKTKRWTTNRKRHRKEILARQKAYLAEQGGHTIIQDPPPSIEIKAEVKAEVKGDSHINGFNYLAFHHFSQEYIKRMEARMLARSYINRTQHTLSDYSSFLERESIQEANRDTWHHCTNYLAGRGWGKATIALYQSVLRMFYRFLVSEGFLDIDPFTGLQSPKLDRRLPQFLSVKEANTLVESPDTTTPFGQRDKAILHVLYASGIRCSELTSLDLKQVNLETNELRVWGKGSKERMVLIGKPASKALIDYLNEARPHLLNGVKTTAVFLNHLGTRLSSDGVERMVKRYGAESLGKRVYPHLLRHTFATHLLDGGANLRVIQELLGHASINSTEIYTHVSREHLKRVYLSAHPRGENKTKEEL